MSRDAIRSEFATENHGRVLVVNSGNHYGAVFLTVESASSGLTEIRLTHDEAAFLAVCLLKASPNRTP